MPLTDQGEAEARALAPALAGMGFSAVLTSPLQRARRTCDLAGLGDGARPCDDLMEWDYGDYEGRTTAEIRRDTPGWTVWTHGCPGGENAAQLEVRCRRVITLASALAPARVALVAHGHLLRALTGTWLGLGATGGALFALETGTLGVLGHERERPVILRWNVPPTPPSA